MARLRKAITGKRGHDTGQAMDRQSEVFRPVDNRSVVDAVVQQIEALIIDGVLRQGMRLPAERELSERFKVSRVKLREALQQLEQSGLIASRQGDGTYVARLTGDALSPAMIALYGRHERGFEDYLEYRREIEAFAARLAAQRATDVDKGLLGDCLARQAQAVADVDHAAALAEDIRFHTTVVEAAHNSMLTHTTTSLYELTEQGIMYNRQAMRGSEDAPARLLAQHRDIVQAIVSGSASAAASAAEAHLDFVAQAVRTAVAAARRSQIAEDRHRMNRR